MSDPTKTCCDLWPLCDCGDEEPDEEDIEVEFVEDDDPDIIRNQWDAERQYMPETRSNWIW
jgi:hypothetical protein